MMKHWSMVVDTGDYGYVTLECDAENKEEAEKKFREQVSTDTFSIIYGSLYDFKKHTIKECAKPVRIQDYATSR